MSDEVDPEKLDLHARQLLLDRGVNEFSQVLFRATGKPPKAILMVVHWPDSIMFAHVMGNAPPQAQMNAIDLMLSHMSKMAQKIKTIINTQRHTTKKDEA